MPEPLRTVVSMMVDDSGAALDDEFAPRVRPYGGEPAETPGVATFESSADAVRFAIAVRSGMSAAGARSRTGIDVVPTTSGTATTHLVSVALAEYAAPGEILVTDIVRRLAGPAPGARYADRGRVRPPGIDDRHQLHAVMAGDEDDVGPAFGRDEELAVVDRSLDETIRGDGRALLIEGPAGIGKSHLAQAALAAARRRGMGIVTSRADELGFEGAGLLSTLAGALGVREDGVGRGGDPAYAVIEDVIAAIHHRVVGSGSVLVVAEDVHWADDTSVRALLALARATRSSPVCLLMTARPTPRPPALERCISLLAERSLDRIGLRALDESATVGLSTTRLGALPGAALRQRLEATEGNPLYVLELLRSLEDEGRLRIEQGVADIAGAANIAGHAPAGSHDGIMATVLRRLRALPAETAEILELASLLGTTFTLEDVANIASRRVVDVATALRPALDADLVEGDGDRLAFRHDLVREAVYEAIAPAIRRDLHAAAGRALAGAGAPARAVAGQFAVGARPGDELAVAWLLRAAEESQAVDTRAAIAHYERALELMSSSGQATRDRTEALLVELQAWSGRVPEATRTAESLLSRTLSPEDERTAHRARAAALATAGDLVGAAEACRHALATDPPEDEADVLRCAAAGMDVIAGRNVAHAIDVATGPAGSEDRVRACWAEQTLGIAALAEARFEEARTHFQRSGALLDAGFIPPLGFLLPYTWETGALAYLDRFDDARAMAHRARSRAEARGDLGMIVQAQASLSLVHFSAGEWDEATAEVATLHEIAEETGAEAHRVVTHAVLAGIAFDRGDIAGARREVGAGIAAIEREGGHLYGSELLAWTAARLAEADGNQAEARAVLELLWSGMAPITYLLLYELPLPMLIRLRLADDDRAGTDELVAAAEGGDLGETPTSRAVALHCRGLVHGDPELLIEAADASRRSPRRMYHVTLLEDTARVLTEAGREDEARPLLAEAESVLADIGAEGWLDRLHRPSGTRSSRSAPRPSRATHGWESLSPKEHEVVDLVAEGLSNPEIGERLFISRRTVESHLSHVFRKLDLSNRTQLARECLERRGSAGG